MKLINVFIPHKLAKKILTTCVVKCINTHSLLFYRSKINFVEYKNCVHNLLTTIVVSYHEVTIKVYKHYTKINVHSLPNIIVIMTTSTNLKNGFKITTMVEQVSKKKPKHRTKAHTVNKYYKPETRATDQNYIENRTKYLAMKEQNAGLCLLLRQRQKV